MYIGRFNTNEMAGIYGATNICPCFTGLYYYNINTIKMICLVILAGSKNVIKNIGF